MNDNVELLHYSYRTFNSYEWMSVQKLSTIPNEILLLRQPFNIHTTITSATIVAMTLTTTDGAHDNHR
jgi:hypothetical protein